MQFALRACSADDDSRTSPTPSLERIIVSPDGTRFIGADSGAPFIAWGVNYDHDAAGRLIEDYWHDEWPTIVGDFREIRGLGANTVRIHLQLGQFMETAEEPNRRNLARLARLIELAEETGLYLDITGLGCYHKDDVPAWYDALSEEARWDVQARFWREVAQVGRASPAVFCYDLMNEPILPGGEVEREWLAGELGGKHFVQRISLDLAGRTRAEVARKWVAKLADAIRAVDDQHLITVGVIPWALSFKGAQPLFHGPEAGEPLDFVAVHFYPRTGQVEEALAALAVYDVGKPLIVEEIFPLRASVEELDAFISQASNYVDGWISFYWGSTIEENEQRGDVAGAITAEWLRHFRRRAADFAPRSEPSAAP